MDVVKDEYDKLIKLAQNLGNESFIAATSSSHSKPNVEVQRLKRENLRLTKENQTLRRLSEEKHDGTNKNVHTLQLQIASLTAELISEREAVETISSNHNSNNHIHNTNSNNDDDSARLLARIAKLEKRNQKDHQKMRNLRSELLAQSREADQLVRQNDSYLRQSNNMSSTQHSMRQDNGRGEGRSGNEGATRTTATRSTTRTREYNGTATNSTNKTEDRLENLEHEYSELQRGGDDLMFSSISGIQQSSDDSSMYQTALPYDRRQSMNIDLGNSKIHVDRNGDLDMQFTNTKGRKTKTSFQKNDALGMDELQ